MFAFKIMSALPLDELADIYMSFNGSRKALGELLDEKYEATYDGLADGFIEATTMDEPK